jgi:phage terminase large subunit-like protein
MWDLSCRDWEQRIREGRSLVPDLPIDTKRAEKGLAIFDRLKFPDIEGTPTMAEACGPWFRELVSVLFGCFEPSGRERMIHEFLLMVPKKNNKTTGAAALAVTALLENKRPRASFVLVGPTQAIADTGFDQAMGMIEADEDLKNNRLHVAAHKKTITVRRPGSAATLKVKTFDTKILTGAKPVGVIIDELHELGTMADGADVIRQLRSGIIANPEAFLIFITTQSPKPPAGVFEMELKKARAIRDGTLKSDMLPVLYEFPESMVKDSDEWRDPDNWGLVNPNIGRSVQLPRLITLHDESVAKGEEELRSWASQHLNIEIGVALRSHRWRGADFWELRGDPDLADGPAPGRKGLLSLLRRCEVAVIGIDGGGLDDLLGLVVLGREKGTRRWLIWVHAWCDRGVLELRKEIAPMLLSCEAEGSLTITDDVGDDIEQVGDIVELVLDSGLLPDKRGIGLDTYGVSEITDELVRRGIEPESELIAGIGQGWKLNNAIITLARKLKKGDSRHGGTKLMAWCVGNAKVEARSGAQSIDKYKAGVAKIDPLIAALNATILMALNPEAAGSYYADNDLVGVA